MASRKRSQALILHRTMLARVDRLQKEMEATRKEVREIKRLLKRDLPDESVIEIARNLKESLEE